MAPRLLELNNTLRHMLLFLGSPVWGLDGWDVELDSMMPVGPFQQGILSGSILLFCGNAN